MDKIFDLYKEAQSDNSKPILYPYNDFPEIVHKALKIVESTEQKKLREEHFVWSPDAFIVALEFNIDIFKLIHINEAVNVHTLAEDPYTELNEINFKNLKDNYNE